MLNNKVQLDETESHKKHETILVPKLLRLTKSNAERSVKLPKILASSSEDNSGRGSATSFIHSSNFRAIAVLTTLALFWTFLTNC